MIAEFPRKLRGLYKVAKSNYAGRCSYCGKALAGELRLIGWDICKECDQAIVNGANKTPIYSENWYN